jgi:hypothetical protein
VTRLAPEALMPVALEVRRVARRLDSASQPYAVDLHEQTGGNVLVVLSFMGGDQDRFHVDQLGVIHR